MLFVIVVAAILLRNFLPDEDKKFLMTLFVVGISLRIILFLVFYVATTYFGGNGEITPDSRAYFLKTLDMLRAWTGQNLSQIQTPVVEESVGKSGYLYILAFFYLIMGYNPVNPNPPSIFSDKLINCLVGILSGIVVFYLAKDIFGRKVAKISSLLSVFYPSILLWSMTNSREASNILLICLIVFSLVRIQKQKKLSYVILLFISLALLKFIRYYLFFVILPIVILSFLYFFMRSFRKKISIVITLVVITAVFLGLISYGRITKNKFFNFNYYVERIYNANQGILSEKGPIYEIYEDDFLSMDKPVILKLINPYFKGLFYFMLVPFPWVVISKMQILTTPQIIIWYLMFPFIFIGMFLSISRRFRISFSLLSCILLVTSFFALTEGNIATAMRHRDLLLPFYFIFCAVGLVRVFDPKALFAAKEG